LPKRLTIRRDGAHRFALALLVVTAWPLAAVGQTAPGPTAPRPDTPAPVESPPARASPAVVAGASAAAPAAAPVAGPAPGPNAAIKKNAVAEIREEDLLLLSTDLDGLTITDALPAYGEPTDPLLPLGELARLLDLNVTVSPPDGKILGRIGQAERPITIDLENGVYRLAGAPIALTPADTAVTNVDIYMRASALAKFLPITFKTEVDGLLLHLHGLEKLPIQSRLDRLSQLRGLRPDTESTEDSLRVPSPYRLFTMPGFDIQGAVGGSFTAPKFTHSYDVRISNDFLFTGLQGYIGSDQNGAISSVRATFERHDTKGKLLGPLHATSFALGDTFTPALPIGARSVGGRGFEFSNAPLEQTSVFNRIDLRGEMPVGYDVELYINDILRSGQRTPVNGRYEFLNVPLVRGINVIRIVLNGPRGERSEETRIINVSGGQLTPGQFTLQMGAVQQDTNLINVGVVDKTATTSDTLTPGAGDLRVSANAAYGLTNQMTLVGGASVFPTIPPVRRDAAGAIIPQTGTREREVATFGLRTGLLGASIQLDAAADNFRSSAVAMGLAAQPFGLNMVGRQVFYQGQFIDETVGTGSGDKAIVSHSELSIDLNAKPFRDTLIPLTLRGTDDLFADHSTTLTGGFRASATADNILMSGGLDMTASLAPHSPVSYSTTGNLSASTFYQFKWQLRANLDYDVQPKFSLQALTLTADRDISDKMALRFGVGKDLSTGNGDTNFQLGDIMHTKFGDLSLTGNYAIPSSHWQVGVSFAIGLIFDPISKRYVFTRPGPAQGGSMVLQAFMDTNGNGVMDPGEKPVPMVTVDGGEHKGTTGADGHALIIGLGVAPTGRVQVGLDNIDDPYVVSPPKTITFNPRPGRTIVVPYPLTAASEVITHVMFRQDGRLVGLSAVRVRLIKAGAPNVQPIEASTEFDGTAGFEDLGVGTYDYQLDPEQAERLHMHLVKPAQIVVPPQGGPVPDLTVEVVFERPATSDSTPKS
jgi:hypothetical protein